MRVSQPRRYFCTGKKRRFFKVFKVAGKIFITTVKQQINKKTR